MSNSAIDFLLDISKGAAAATAVIVMLPVLGSVGTVSAAGALVAVAAGTVVATIDWSNKRGQ